MMRVIGVIGGSLLLINTFTASPLLAKCPVGNGTFCQKGGSRECVDKKKRAANNADYTHHFAVPTNSNPFERIYGLSSFFVTASRLFANSTSLELRSIRASIALTRIPASV